jgi:hypothetical protein
VRSLIKEPFTIDISVFQYGENWPLKFTSATLYVPIGTKEKYEATDGWKNFETIIETDFKDEPRGDVNGDFVVDVADIASVIDVMADSVGADPVSARNADVNKDGVVDVADIASIIDEMAASTRRQD